MVSIYAKQLIEELCELYIQNSAMFIIMKIL